MPDFSLHVYVFICVQKYTHMYVQATCWIQVSSMIIEQHLLLYLKSLFFLVSLASATPAIWLLGPVETGMGRTTMFS